jgi:hypothetical protein
LKAVSWPSIIMRMAARVLTMSESYNGRSSINTESIEENHDLEAYISTHIYT